MPSNNGKKTLIERLRSISILPSNQRFYELFQLQVDEIGISSALLQQLTKSPMNDEECRTNLYNEIKDSETKGDNILREITMLTNKSVTSPFPRQDILNLARLLDDVLDGIEGAANNYINYKITEHVPPIIAMAKIIVEASSLLINIVPALRKFEHPMEIYEQMREFEHRADDINIQTIPQGYLKAGEESDFEGFKKNWIMAVARDKVITKMEKTADSLRHIADTIKEVIAKRV